MPTSSIRPLSHSPAAAIDTGRRAVARLTPHPLAACLAAALTCGAHGLPAAAIDPPSAFDPSWRAASTRDATTKRLSMARANAVGAIGYVTNCDDSGPGSLREAVATAGDPGFVDLGSVACSTITLTTGAIEVPSGTLYLQGLDADKVTIDGNGNDRVFDHTGSGNLVVSGLTLSNGHAIDRGGCIRSAGNVFLYSSHIDDCTATGATDAFGGGIYAANDVRLRQSRLSGNAAVAGSGYAYGGGVYAHRDANVIDSTIAGNSAAAGQGGGVLALGRGLIVRSTISGNSALNGGGLSLGTGSSSHLIAQSTISGNSATRIGGINAHSSIEVYGSTIAFNTETTAFGAGLRVLGEALLQSTIVSGNLSAGVPGDIGGSAGSTLVGANDLIGASMLAVPVGTLSDNPLLAPLADNGGTIRTHALLPGSPAIDHGNLVGNLFTDQRGLGYARVGGGVADIGAYEVQSTGVTTVVANCADSGAGSLRDIVAAASSGDTIDLRSVGCNTIALGGALPVGVGTLTFIGPGAASLTLDGGLNDRVVRHAGYGTLALSGLTLAHGRAVSDSTTASGGCVYSRGGVTLESVTVTGCSADSPVGAMGGGLWMSGPALVQASVISGNSVTSASSMVYGGGLMSTGLEMRDSTLSGNSALTTATSGYSRGGGALLGGRVAISGSTISGNFATREGGLFLRGNTTLVNSTVSGNSALSDAAGLYAFGFLDLWNSTVTSNTIGGDGASFGAGINAAHVLNLQSSIVYGNRVNGTPYDIAFGFAIQVVGAHNLIGFSLQALPPDTSNADPLLGPLRDNGAGTLTHALLAGSPAIDAGVNPLDLEFDQRGTGFARAVGAAADIGAIEFTPVADTVFANGFE